MSKVLVVLAHPDISKSIGNKTIIEKFKKLKPDAEFDELYKLYPNFKIDVKKEQEKLKKADIIIFQFPMYWYNCPSLMRKWFEDVLEHGFAYGTKGKALEGKRLIVSMTTGAPEDAFKQGGFQNFTIEEFTKGFHQLANLCSMKWDGFLFTGGLTFFLKDKAEEMKKMVDKLEKHAENLYAKIKK